MQRGFDTGGNKPDQFPITTTNHYARNNSNEMSSNAGADQTGNRGVLFRTESGDSYGEMTTTLDLGSFGSSSVGDTTLNTRVVPDSESRGNYELHANRSAATLNSRNDWDRVRLSEARSFSSDIRRFGSDIETNESDERYRQAAAEQQRREEEEQQHVAAAQRQREEQERRLYHQRRQEEERRRTNEELMKRQQQQQQQQQEGERKRQQEEAIRRQQQDEQQQRRKMDEERWYRLEQEKRRRVQGSLITGDREETVRGGEFGEFQPRNVTSMQELERLFGSLSKSATGYELYNRQGKHYVQFMGRFRNSADRREYIEFQDGSMFPLQDSYGGQSYYASESAEPREIRFLRIEGELVIDSTTGKGFIVLKDGRRFPLQGSFTSYTEESTYTLDPHSSYQASSRPDDGEPNAWNEKSSQAATSNVEKNYESTRYTHEVRRTEDRRIAGRTYGRENRETLEQEEEEEEEEGRASSTKIPNSSKGLRLEKRRETDGMMADDVSKDFEKKFEKLGRRIPRDLRNDAPTPESREFDGEDYENDPRMQGSVDPCNTAKCVMLKCVLGPLKKDEEVWIGARYRVDARTLRKVALQEKVRVSTKLVARVTKQPFIGTPAEQVVKSHEIKTNVEPSVTPSVPDVIPLWVVVLSACAGTIILLLLIFLLHKVCSCKSSLFVVQETRTYSFYSRCFENLNLNFKSENFLSESKEKDFPKKKRSKYIFYKLKRFFSFTVWVL